MMTDEQWGVLEALIQACRPHTKRPSPELRRTISAILWRHENGAKWRSIPADNPPTRSSMSLDQMLTEPMVVSQRV